MSKIKKKQRLRRAGSLLMSALDAFTAFIYSLFANGRMGSWLSSDEGENKSFIISLSRRVTYLLKRNAVSERIDIVLKNSFFLKLPEAIRSFLSELSLNVYGMFAIIYGSSALVMYFISILVNGSYIGGENAPFTSFVIIVCSLPLLVSSKSLIASVSRSRIMSRIFLSFFAIPEEKMKTEKRRGGVVHMFFAVGIALILGAATYIIHPLYVPVIIACVAVVCMISANPESGVAITVVAAPFLQYTDDAELILNVMVVVTLVSYLFKVLRHRRALDVSAEGMLVLIFCGFIITAGTFSSAGEGALWRSLFAVVIILGGFFTSSTLIRGKDRLAAFVKMISASFTSLAVIGVWSVFYNGIADGVTYSIREYVQPIFEGNNLYIADSSAVFSVLAVLSVPPIFAAMTKKSSAIRTVLLLTLLSLIMGACFIYGTYETVVAILIEFCIFWVIYSHKTLNVVILLLIPLGMLAVASPFILRYVDVTRISDTVSRYLPLVSPSSSYLNELFESTVKLIANNPIGIGAGETTFAAALVDHANAVTSGATDPGSFYLQLVCWSGLGGALVFAVFAGFILKKSIGFLAVAKDKELRADTLALTCGVFGALIFGSVNCIWNDPRMLYLFWTMVGLLVSCIREGKALEDTYLSEFSSDNDNADVELRFYN